MSYHIYTTKGLILKERPLKEADKSIKILTRDLGLINAIAIGARKGSSKRSPALTELSLGKFSLVRGKKDWRVTNAELNINIYAHLKNNKKLLHALVRPISLVEKLVQGEEKNKNLYDILENTIDFIIENILTEEEIKNIEIYTVAKLLVELGYLDKNNSLEIDRKEKLTKEHLDSLNKDKVKVVRAINKGIRASGLV
jgi:DNA repair protein RecO